jgi:hypothetical protein
MLMQIISGRAMVPSAATGIAVVARIAPVAKAAVAKVPVAISRLASCLMGGSVRPMRDSRRRSAANGHDP